MKDESFGRIQVEAFNAKGTQGEKFG